MNVKFLIPLLLSAVCFFNKANCQQPFTIFSAGLSHTNNNYSYDNINGGIIEQKKNGTNIYMSMNAEPFFFGKNAKFNFGMKVNPYIGLGRYTESFSHNPIKNNGLQVSFGLDMGLIAKYRLKENLDFGLKWYMMNMYDNVHKQANTTDADDFGVVSGFVSYNQFRFEYGQGFKAKDKLGMAFWNKDERSHYYTYFFLDGKYFFKALSDDLFRNSIHLKFEYFGYNTNKEFKDVIQNLGYSGIIVRAGYGWSFN